MDPGESSDEEGGSSEGESGRSGDGCRADRVVNAYNRIHYTLFYFYIHIHIHTYLTFFFPLSLSFPICISLCISLSLSILSIIVYLSVGAPPSPQHPPLDLEAFASGFACNAVAMTSGAFWQQLATGMGQGPPKIGKFVYNAVKRLG